jgi:hypothetical protein
MATCTYGRHPGVACQKSGVPSASSTARLPRFSSKSPLTVCGTPQSIKHTFARPRSQVQTSPSKRSARDQGTGDGPPSRSARIAAEVDCGSKSLISNGRSQVISSQSGNRYG